MADPELNDDQMHPAKYALIGVFGLAIVAAFGGWWYAANLQQRAIQFWTPEHAQLIVQSEQFDALRLEPVEGEPVAARETIMIDHRRWQVIERFRASRSNGQMNIRYAFLNDHSFDWSAPSPSEPPTWHYALQFTTGDRRATIALDTDAGRACLVETGAQVAVKPMLAGLVKFLEYVFADRAPSADEKVTAG